MEKSEDGKTTQNENYQNRTIFGKKTTTARKNSSNRPNPRSKVPLYTLSDSTPIIDLTTLHEIPERQKRYLYNKSVFYTHGDTYSYILLMGLAIKLKKMKKNSKIEKFVKNAHFPIPSLKPSPRSLFTRTMLIVCQDATYKGIVLKDHNLRTLYHRRLQLKGAAQEMQEVDCELDFAPASPKFWVFEDHNMSYYSKRDKKRIYLNWRLRKTVLVRKGKNGLDGSARVNHCSNLGWFLGSFLESKNEVFCVERLVIEKHFTSNLSVQLVMLESMVKKSIFGDFEFSVLGLDTDSLKDSELVYASADLRERGFGLFGGDCGKIFGGMIREVYGLNVQKNAFLVTAGILRMPKEVDGGQNSARNRPKPDEVLKHNKPKNPVSVASITLTITTAHRKAVKLVEFYTFPPKYTRIILQKFENFSTKNFVFFKFSYFKKENPDEIDDEEDREGSQGRSMNSKKHDLWVLRLDCFGLEMVAEGLDNICFMRVLPFGDDFEAEDGVSGPRIGLPAKIEVMSKRGNKLRLLTFQLDL